MHGVGASYIDRAFQVAGFLPVIHVKEQKGKELKIILILILKISTSFLYL
jgi:hypothetical protein